ncbi:hypothetical protein MHO32_18425, partial [Vibrio sp. MMH1-50]|nr:hypothetical protein [Vibrio sp. MMH1-50]
MTNNINFRAFLPSDKEDCLRIFDENCPEYTQVTSRCRIQSVVIDSRARKATQCNSQLFPSC